MTSSSVEHHEELSENKSKRYVRPINELWEMWKPRVKMRIYPFTYVLYDDMERVMNSLTSYYREKWATAFSSVAKPYEEKAAQAEKAGDTQSAKENYLLAYHYYRLARFPTINSEGKKQAYRKSQEMLLKAARYFDFPIERVEIPFKPHDNEGKRIIAYLRVPKAGTEPFPLLFSWGGIDGFKEEQLNDEVLEHGLATLAIDGPGVGDSPLKGSENAERLFEAVLDWIGTRKELDAKKVAIWGYSTGGYWAVKVAHVYKDRIACAVSQGGPVHYAFEPEWINQQERGEYAFEVYDTLAFAFGKSGYEEWVEYASKLSLLKQGILDKPCAPLLLVNGVHDSLFPIKDYYLLLEHGNPKCARFFEAEHMGFTKDTNKIITDWIYEKLT
jgi:esterase FrsA